MFKKFKIEKLKKVKENEYIFDVKVTNYGWIYFYCIAIKNLIFNN